VNVFRMILGALLLLSTPVIGIAAASTGADTKPQKCSARNSERATVPQIAAEPEKYMGRCVTVDAVMQAAFLFDSVDGVYLQAPDRLNPASSGHRIGLDNISRHFSDRYRHVSIAGRVQDCETVRNCAAASGPEGAIIMVTGYCHYFNGPYVFVQDLRFRGGPSFERRMGSYDRKDYGDLEPAPENWPHRAKVEALTGEFLRALRSKDRERLAGLHFRDVGLDWKDEEATLLRFLLNSRSPFAGFRTGQKPPQQLILVERSRLYSKQEESEDREAVSDYSAIVCFCREASCDGRWPIAKFDADNMSTRPYACTEVGPYLDDGRWVPHFTTRIGKNGLAEPRVRQ
jgi:hypothetical protein